MKAKNRDSRESWRSSELSRTRFSGSGIRRAYRLMRRLAAGAGWTKSLASRSMGSVRLTKINVLTRSTLRVLDYTDRFREPARGIDPRKAPQQAFLS